MLKKALASAFVICSIASYQAFAEDGTIGHLFKDKPAVKVYVKDVSNESGSTNITAEAFKSILEESLANRKAMTFRIVSDPAESDIRISAVIKKFQYLKKGPFKPSIGIQTTLLDAAATMTENYAEMAVGFIVTDTKNDKVLWKADVDDYIKKLMTAECSTVLMCDKIARGFIWQCFGKANRREGRGRFLI
jgi:hypothetical protein